MTEFSGFPGGLVPFLMQLAANNDRDWFKANEKRYEALVRGPSLAFVRAIRAPLAELAPHLVADDRKVGGSMFRIFRDTRFSKDKTPYKTHLGIHFRHAATTKDVHAPGFYLGIGPDEIMCGGGIWHPPPETLRAVRDAIVARPDVWAEARKGVPAMWGEQAKRVPAGYDAAHPHAEDLKRKDFVSSVPLTAADIVAPGFIDRYADACRQLVPLQRFLTGAMGLSW